MDLKEWGPVLVIVGTLLGIASTILSFMVGVLRSHLRTKDEQITQLKLDNKSLEADLAKAEGNAEDSRRKADHILEAGRVEHLRRKEAERRLSQAAEEAVGLRNQVEQLQAALGRCQKKHRDALDAVTSCGSALAEEKRLRAEAEQRAAELQAKVGELESIGTELTLAKETIAAQQRDLERYEAQIDSVAKHDGRVWSTKPVAEPPAFIPLTKRLHHRPVVISMMNLKGGVGKTTLTANLGGYLASEREKWVLLLDLDHQRSLTQALFTTAKRQAAAASQRTIQDFFRSEPTGVHLQRAAEQFQGLDRFWIVGNADAEKGYGTLQNLDDLEMDLLGNWLLNPAGRDIRYLLRCAVHSELIQDRYDYVLIDCPPRLTTACINALAASDYILIPAQPEQVSASSVYHLLRRLRPLRESGIISDLKVLGIVGNMVSADACKPGSHEGKLLRQLPAPAADQWGCKVRLTKSMIRYSDYYAKYSREAFEKGSVQLPAIVVTAIKEQYEKLTKEIEGYIHEDLGTA